mgnify:CR=1 FL=1
MNYRWCSYSTDNGHTTLFVQIQNLYLDQFKTEAKDYFTKNKDSFNKVTYALIRNSNLDLTKELYLQIEAKENNIYESHSKIDDKYFALDETIRFINCYAPKEIIICIKKIRSVCFASFNQKQNYRVLVIEVVGGRWGVVPASQHQEILVAIASLIRAQRYEMALTILDNELGGGC